MQINEKTILYLVLFAIITTIVGHLTKREMMKRYPIDEG